MNWRNEINQQKDSVRQSKPPKSPAIMANTNKAGAAFPARRNRRECTRSRPKLQAHEHIAVDEEIRQPTYWRDPALSVLSPRQRRPPVMSEQRIQNKMASSGHRPRAWPMGRW